MPTGRKTFIQVKIQQAAVKTADDQPDQHFIVLTYNSFKTLYKITSHYSNILKGDTSWREKYHLTLKPGT